jgi:branched-subunit amino acid transport protein
MSLSYVVICIIAMALVTYATRVISMVLFKRKIQNRFINSFLFYTPYTVLAALVFPGIFYSTDYIISAAAGGVTAFILAFLGGKLLIVAGGAVAAVYLTELLIKLI